MFMLCYLPIGAMGRAFGLCNCLFDPHITRERSNDKGAHMQTQNKFFEDLSKVMTNAMGVAQGAKTEAETAMKSWMDRWLADRDFVSREEFDAVRLMAQKAREENVALAARLDALEAKKPAAKKAAAKK
jgi:BMFP domain-containing protein YqiC